MCGGAVRDAKALFLVNTLCGCAVSSQITSNATSDLNIKADGSAVVRGNEGVFIMGKTIEFHMGGNMVLKTVSDSRINKCVLADSMGCYFFCLRHSNPTPPSLKAACNKD